jgi:hypothetical protein
MSVPLFRPDPTAWTPFPCAILRHTQAFTFAENL